MKKETIKIFVIAILVVLLIVFSVLLVNKNKEEQTQVSLEDSKLTEDEIYQEVLTEVLYGEEKYITHDENGNRVNTSDKMKEAVTVDGEKDLEVQEIDITSKDNKNAKLSELEYETIGHINCKTIVKINLITGRHHQIRVQFSNIGYPLYGDQLYGRKNEKQIRLFAYKLEFMHPTLKTKMQFKLLPKWKELEDETIIHRL